MNLVGTRTIETKRCILRRIIENDYVAMYENWARYEEVCRYFPFNPIADINIYKEKVKRWSEGYISNSYFNWVIELKESKKLIGIINLGNFEESCFMSDTCYMLSPEYWGQGIMTEVLNAVLDYAFNVIELNRVQAEVFAGNIASECVLKKAGFKLEGIMRQKYYKNEKFIDTSLYAIIRDDYKLL